MINMKQQEFLDFLGENSANTEEHFTIQPAGRAL